MAVGSLSSAAIVFIFSALTEGMSYTGSSVPTVDGGGHASLRGKTIEFQQVATWSPSACRSME